MKRIMISIPITLLLIWVLFSQFENSSVPQIDSPEPKAEVSAPSAIQNIDQQQITPIVDDGIDSAPTIQPAIEWSIAGRIFGPDGQPVTNGFAELDPPPSHVNIELSSLGACDGNGVFIIQVQKDYVGHLLARAHSPGNSHRNLWVGQRIEAVRAVQGVEPTLEIHLQEGRWVEGLVIDRQGNPVQNASITTAMADSNRSEAGFFFSGNRPDPSDLLWPTTSTDVDGHFLLEGIPHGPCSIQAGHGDAHGGYRKSDSQNLPPGTLDVILTLHQSIELPVRLIDIDGRPIVSYEGSVCLYEVEEGEPVRTQVACFSTGPNPSSASQTLFPKSIGTVVVVAIDDHRFTPYSRQIEISHGQNSPIEIVLHPAAILRGRVVDSSQRPIPDAVVSLLDNNQHFFSRYDHQDQRNHWSLATAMATLHRRVTGPDGEFEIEPVATDRTVRLQVEHRDYLPLQLESTTYHAGGQDVGNLVLSSGIQLRGLVLSPSGSPVAGAQVRLKNLAAATEPQSAFSLTFSDQGIQLTDRQKENTSTCTSDKDGQFILKLEKGGFFDLDATAPGFHSADPIELDVQSPIDGLVLHLNPMVSIEGFVIDDRSVPISGVRIELSKQISGEKDLWALFGGGSRGGIFTTSNHQGFFSAELPSRGFFSIGVAAGQPWVVSDAPIAESGSTDVTLVVLDAGRIEGKVVDALTGKPITLFLLKHGMPEVGNGFFFGGKTGFEFSDPEGFFDIEGLEQLEYELIFESTGYITTSERVQVELGQTTQVVVALETAATIIGRILDEHGRPIVGARVTRSRPGEEAQQSNQPETYINFADGRGGYLTLGKNISIRTDEEGRFCITGIEGGHWRLHMMAKEHQDLTIEVQGAAAGVITDTGNHPMPPIDTSSP